MNSSFCGSRDIVRTVSVLNRTCGKQTIVVFILQPPGFVSVVSKLRLEERGRAMRKKD